MERLLYRRQFLLSTQVIEELDSWNRFNLASYYLYVHPDLEITEAENEKISLKLLGYIFDPKRPNEENQEILDKIVDNNTEFKSLIRSLKSYTGRYAIFYNYVEKLYLIQDALALREVYYCTMKNRVICGSQPNLLERYSKPKVMRNTNPEYLDFTEIHFPYNRNGRLWPGDGTLYDGVKHLLPNHYLDIEKLESNRYWPNEPLKKIELEDAIVKCASFLQGAMKAAANRHPLMLAVTAGLDSRGLLAASKDIKDSIYYFINKQEDRLSDRSSDIKIPRQLFRRLGLIFNVHTVPDKVPGDYKKLFMENTCYANEALAPVVYNIYHKQNSNKLNILGVGEIGRTKFFNDPKKLTPYYLSYMLRYRKSSFAVRECKKWLCGAESIARKYELNIMTLFWWEVLIGNWGAVGNSESDIAIEEYDPYNSHFLFETFLSIDSKFRTFRDNILFKELIRYMWPELLEIPYNPPDNLKLWLYFLLHKMRLEMPFRNSKFRLYEILYNWLWRDKDIDR